MQEIEFKIVPSAVISKTPHVQSTCRFHLLGVSIVIFIILYSYLFVETSIILSSKPYYLDNQDCSKQNVTIETCPLVFQELAHKGGFIILPGYIGSIISGTGVVIMLFMILSREFCMYYDESITIRYTRLKKVVLATLVSNIPLIVSLVTIVVYPIDKLHEILVPVGSIMLVSWILLFFHVMTIGSHFYRISF